MNNFNLVLRTYTAMRQMTADDLALLNTLRALGDTDREKLIEAMSDKPQKKSSKKSAGGGGSGKAKSKHASSLAEKVGGTLASIAKTVGGDDDNARKIIDAMDHDDDGSGRCQAKRSDDRICMLLPDHNIHHLTTANEYHEFVAPPASSAAGAGD